MADLSAPRIQDWIRWLNATKDLNYKPWSLLAVYKADGKQMLLAVLKAAKLERTDQLIEAMCEQSSARSPRKDVGESTDALPLEDVSRT